MTTSEQPPQTPNSLPKYIARGLPKQDNETLEDALDYITELIEWRQRPIAPSDLPADAEPVENDSNGTGTLVEEYVTCGDPTCHCAEEGDKGHGPYLYRYFRDDGTLKSEYVGKV